VLRRPGIDFWSTNVSTDSRKNIVGNWSGEVGCDREGECDRSTSLSLQVRPAPNVSISVGPSLGHQETGFQYVTTVSDPTATTFSGQRYVFARLIQNSVSMNTRFSVTFSPNLTFEAFLQPLIASGAYSRYSESERPRGLRRLVYGVDVGTVTTQPGDPARGLRDSIFVDPDGTGPAARFAFEDPSFTFRSLRGNAVLRWEYRPGSTLFVVWARSGSSELTHGGIDFGRDTEALFRGPAENIFLVKVNYWLGL
jgi:hypothetical protein